MPTQDNHRTRFDLVIEPGLGLGHYWAEVLRYRELFYFLAWRDLLVRYKQTTIGIAWAALRPLLTMIIFTVVFGRLAKLPTDGSAPYALMVYAGMLPWQFFASSVSESSNSLVGNANLISKVYFPRIIIPTSSVMTCFVDFLIAFLLMLPLMAWYQFWPTWRVLMLPFFVLIAFMAAMGIGLWMTALNVKYRDFRHIVPFLVQIGLYISPVGFSANIVPAPWRLLYALNPMVGVIDGFRWALLGSDANVFLPGMVLSFTVAVGAMIAGIWYFRRAEKCFADVI